MKHSNARSHLFVKAASDQCVGAACPDPTAKSGPGVRAVRALAARPDFLSCLAQVLSMGMSFSRRPWFYHRQDASYSKGQTHKPPLSTESRRPSHHPRRKLLRALIWAMLAWSAYFYPFCPVSQFQGLAQGLIHGWDSQCGDWLKCEGDEPKGVLKWLAR